MIKVLEDAIEKIKKLPADRQAVAAEVLEQIASDIEAPMAVPVEDRAAVMEGLDQAHRVEFAAEADVDALLNKPWTN
jgi:hypothetical protein